MLGHVGVWSSAFVWGSAAEARELAQEAEELGYGALWFGEGGTGKESLSNAALLLGATKRITVATGISNIWARDATAMRAGGDTLSEAFPGRFLHGLGVSHMSQVSGRGHDYGKPISTMRAYLDAMDAAKYTAPAPQEPTPRVLAALRPKMLELARDRTAGAHSYFMPPAHSHQARLVLGTTSVLAAEQAVLLETDPVRAREIAREHTAVSLSMPNYVNALRWVGFDESDVEGAGSDRLVDAIVAWGDVDAIRARVREHLDAGADHVAVQALGTFSSARRQLRELAPALRGAGE
ncbi:TIGR03620 family F420-dependent LLM class oxidoreductase [Allokutzneria sp. A3M-2-11 16]|uniref:TIGR03620 family F420-dependent LLM class oxidoreductase n=1 Tax=Allokutzneria sp. A3M-2-11 16 TaxID=2962043 RepID=UPI0020B7E901|nr:TIGR03620 family F420-dependent LLM class oxidoreductase [Allokutzneria sp. A3M-2-11 16]MCP3804177.1 TIGR03620 family F420-dependent LLM class oxidoreductase [Allokutzneria sp. A3M-2-11 16]